MLLKDKTVLKWLRWLSESEKLTHKAAMNHQINPKQMDVIVVKQYFNLVSEGKRVSNLI